MTILAGDLKIFKSDTMDDTDQGGGSATTDVIVDGDSNNIFEDISTLDRVYGAVKMRKVFPHVFVQNVDKYFGSHLIISKLPKDEKIGVNLFNTEDWFDRRPSAQSRVENYRARGGKYNGNLWSTQYKDSKVISIFQNESAEIPSIGDVLYLSSSVRINEFQYIKIVTLEESMQTFVNNNGSEYEKRVLDITISQSLEYDFIGVDVVDTDPSNVDGIINRTVVANASKYYSARPLNTVGNATDTTVNVDTVYSQVIPSSLQELAILDADAGGTTNGAIESAQEGIVISGVNTGGVSAGYQIYLGSGCLPNSVTFNQYGAGSIIDKGGQLVYDGDVTNTSVGNIDYSSGVATFTESVYLYPSYSFTPATVPTVIADTAILQVTENNRGYIWTINIQPPPKPGSLRVSYMALGNWYDMYDNADGKIDGLEDGIGAGTIDYVTGSASVTLQALPDAYSAIVWSWGKEAEFTNRSSIAPSNISLNFNLADEGIARGTFVATWNDGTARTATANNGGDLSGDATGTINVKTGVVELIPNNLPLGGQEFTFDYDKGDPLEQTFTPTASNGDITVDLNVGGIIPESVELSWTTGINKGWISDLQWKYALTAPAEPNQYANDDGVGGIAGGTIDYGTGIINFNADIMQDGSLANYAYYNRTYCG